MRPVLSHKYPKRVAYWEERPNPSPRRRRFSGLSLVIDTVGQNATVTPVLDGTDQTAFTVNTSKPLTRALTAGAVVGRDLWAKIQCATGVRVYGVQPIVIDEFPDTAQGYLPTTNLDTERVKVCNAVEIAACTLGAARTFRAVLDGVLDATELVMTSGADRPADGRIVFSTLKEFKRIGLHVDGDVEIHAWKPIVLYTLPGALKIWETGPVDLGSERLAWIKEVRIKCRTADDIEVTPYFDDAAFAKQTCAVPVAERGKTAVFRLRMPRSYKGRQPRLIVEAKGGALFYPWWVEFYHRGTGSGPSYKPVRVNA